MKRITFFLLALSTSVFAGYSTTQAYDLIADGNCREAFKLIEDESKSLINRKKSSEVEGKIIIARIQSFCDYIKDIKAFYKQAKQPTMQCKTSSEFGVDKQRHENSEIDEEGSLKLKKYIAELRKNIAKTDLIVKWKQKGFIDDDEIETFIQKKIPVDTALAWKVGRKDPNVGYDQRTIFTVKEMFDWRNKGFSPDEAITFKQKNITFKIIAEKKLRYDFLKANIEKLGGLYYLTNWFMCEISDEDLYKWSTISSSCEDAKKWIESGLNFEEAQKWHSLTEYVEIVMDLIKYGIKYDEAEKWLSLDDKVPIFDLIKSGIKFEETEKWFSLGKDVPETMALMQSGIKFEEIKSWIDKDFALSQINEWRNVNIPPDEASLWKEMNVDFDAALEWKKNGFKVTDKEVPLWIAAEVEAKTAKEFSKNKISTAEYLVFKIVDITTPKQIAAILKPIRQKCKIPQNKYAIDAIKILNDISKENPYDTKGKCYSGTLSFGNLRSKNEAFFYTTDGEPVLVKTQTSVPVNGVIFGYFYSKGVTIHKNALNVEKIMPALDAIWIQTIK